MGSRDRWQMSNVPWERRSVRLPLVLSRGPRTLDIGPGLPWPVVSGAVTVVVVLLAWFGAERSGLAGLVFPVGFLAALVVGVCAVRRDQLAVPAMQAPLVATIGVVGSAVLAGHTASTTGLLLAVLAPLAELFWWLVVTTVACLLVALVRSDRLRAAVRPQGS